jgi:hypothetical protein
VILEWSDRQGDLPREIEKISLELRTQKDQNRELKKNAVTNEQTIRRLAIQCAEYEKKWKSIKEEQRLKLVEEKLNSSFSDEEDLTLQRRIDQYSHTLANQNPKSTVRKSSTTFQTIKPTQSSSKSNKLNVPRKPATHVNPRSPMKSTTNTNRKSTHPKVIEQKRMSAREPTSPMEDVQELERAMRGYYDRKVQEHYEHEEEEVKVRENIGVSEDVGYKSSRQQNNEETETEGDEVVGDVENQSYSDFPTEEEDEEQHETEEGAEHEDPQDEVHEEEEQDEEILNFVHSPKGLMVANQDGQNYESESEYQDDFV